MTELEKDSEIETPEDDDTFEENQGTLKVIFYHISVKSDNCSLKTPSPYIHPNLKAQPSNS
jgi:hypothetical protein